MGSDHDAYFEEVEARFENALDFDLGLEEEFHVLDVGTLELAPGFEALRDAAPERLRNRIAGELLRSEIEVSTPRTLHFGQAARQMLLNRAELFALADREGYALGATGTHPFSSWKDQEIIDTPHYRLVEERLKYVAWRNNTWAAHVHIGVRGCDRAVAVCDALRTYLPHILALSANSPFIEGVWTQLHSARTQTFVRMFPRCGVPDVFGTWAEHRAFYEELIDTNCIQEFTQIWWSVRPHHRFGTVEIRICDAQTEAWQSLAISSLTVGLVAHLARVYDEGMPLPILPSRYVEENLWRAIRYGLDGSLVDWATRTEMAAPDAIRHLVELSAPYADGLGLTPHLEGVERMLTEGNGAQQQVKAHLEGESLQQVFAGTVARAHAISLQTGSAPEEDTA
jgi:glutamate---cysteine ligase / carboxylate-amine ligase